MQRTNHEILLKFFDWEQLIKIPNLDFILFQTFKKNSAVWDCQSCALSIYLHLRNSVFFLQICRGMFINCIFDMSNFLLYGE